MPSPIRVPIHQKLNSYPTTAEEDAHDAIAAYLNPLLTKHERNQPLVYEDLLESYEVAKPGAASSDSNNPMAQQELDHLHTSQLQAYEAYAKMELTKMAESQEYPSIEEGESMPAYIERVVTTVKGSNPSLRGWRISEEFMEEVFWSKVKAGARKAYFALKSQSIEKDKQGKTADQTTDKVDKVKAFEAAALGALVSKSESQDSEMAEEGEGDGHDDEGGENEEDGDIDDDDAAEDDELDDDDDGDDAEEDEAEAEAEGDDVDDKEEADDDVAQDGGLCGAAEAGANGNDAPAAKTPMKTKKRRRLPNGPLGGGGTGSTADGGKKQPAKKQKTGKGVNGDTTGGAGRGGAGGRGKGGAKNNKAGRGGGGGRGTRKRTRKKGAGAGAGGVA